MSVSPSPVHPIHQRWQLGQRLASTALDEWPAFLPTWAARTGLPVKPADLRRYQRLYQCFPDPAALLPELSWTHYRHLLRLPDAAARSFYLRACGEHGWSAATLARQLRTCYYERHRQTSSLGLKPHYVFELTSLPADERALEDALCNQLRQLLLELGPDFSFLGRQRCLRLSDGQRYFVDLLFYHLRLQTYLLVELKTSPLTHRDIGQLDTYTRWFDARVPSPSTKLTNPGPVRTSNASSVVERGLRGVEARTLGLLLCPSFNPDLLRYSALADRPLLRVATYQVVSSVKIGRKGS